MAPMVFSLAAFLLLAITAEDEADRRAEVIGVVATHVEFRGAGRVKMTEACLELLESCHYSHHPNEGQMPDWDQKVLEIREGKQGYLHVKLSEPRTLKIVGGGEKVTLTEMLVILPLNRGGLFVRNGQWAKAYGKYEPEPAIRVQEQMKYALPVK